MITQSSFIVYMMLQKQQEREDIINEMSSYRGDGLTRLKAMRGFK
jgi:hypothetical protein